MTPLTRHTDCAGCSTQRGAPESEFETDGPQAVRGRVRLHEHHQGWTQIAHGGVVALVMDEAVGTVMTSIDLRAVTARLDVAFRSPCPVNVWLDVAAHVTTHRGRRRDVEVVLSGPDAVVIATATALTLEISDDNPVFVDPRHSPASET